MDDPFSNSAPPSYALESSSGESDWDDLAGAPPQSKSKPFTPDAIVEVLGEVNKGTNVVFLVGEAGENLARGVTVEGEGIPVTVDGEQVRPPFVLAKARANSFLQLGVIHTLSTATLVFLSIALPLVSLHPLASTLLSALAPTSSTILASYHLPSYISSSPDPHLLYLRSTPTDALSSLVSSGTLHPYAPPNLLHGLPSSLLALSTLAGIPSTLILLPTTSVPQPLNGPWSIAGTNTAYDAGGPTELSEVGQTFREVKREVHKVAKELEWSWWSPSEGKGKGFAWLEKKRKDKRREDVGSMYM